MIIINKYHVQCELVKEIFAVYTKGFNVKIFPCLSRYKICLVTKTREFTKDILKRAIIKYINVILDIDKFEISLPTKLHKEFGTGQERKAFRGMLLSIRRKKRRIHV